MSLTVFYGCMFSGKTESLIRAIAGLEPGKKYMVINHVFDSRYSKNAIVTHTGESVAAVSLSKLQNVLPIAKYFGIEHIFIDEGQFWKGLFEAVAGFRSAGINVYVAGLNMTYNAEPFGDMPALITEAGSGAFALYTTCSVCSGNATHTRLKETTSAAKNKCSDDSGAEPILIGGSNLYEAVCKTHFDSAH